MTDRDKLLKLLADLKQANTRLSSIEENYGLSFEEEIKIAVKQDRKAGKFWMRKLCFIIGHNFDPSLLCGPAHRAHCLRCGLDQYSAFPSPFTIAGWLNNNET